MKNLVTSKFRRNRLIGLLLIAVGSLFIAIGSSPLAELLFSILYSLFGPFTTTLPIVPPIVIVLGVCWYFKTEDSEAKIVAKAFAAAQETHREEPGKAKPVWDMAQLTLEIYFNRNLNQIRWIFWLSIAVMSLGFLLILYGVALGYQNPKENWIIAAVGGIAGVVTEFIGATFLFIYKSSIQQANRYTEILERMNFVGMAMQMLDSVTEDNKSFEQPVDEKAISSLREAKIEMAKVLLTKLQTNLIKETSE